MKAIKIILPVKTVKRLFAAEGYLELGMPQYALEELAAIEDATPVEASVEYLTGEAFRQQERYDDAVKSLERAAQLIPAPFNKVVWLSLSDCFRKRGDDELADIVDSIADDCDAEALESDFDADEHEDDEWGLFDDDDRAPSLRDRWS
jgi:tetratricopeptide (TPR) repeat protein